MSCGSSYEQYNQTHLSYDKTRLPIGNEQLIKLILGDSTAQAQAENRKSSRILDVGCGTGGHLEGFHLAGFTNLYGLDASSTGLAQSRAKVSAAALVCADMRAMPFEDESFDILLFSFSLHHLPHNSEEQLRAATLGVLKEARRLLKPDGQLYIITSTREQLSPDGCLWYYKYFAEAARELASRFLDTAVLADLATQAGFGELAATPVERTYWTEASLDPEGPFDESWRNGDSLFALAAKRPGQLQAGLDALRADIESGAVRRHIDAVRQRTEVIKQAVLMSAGRS